MTEEPLAPEDPALLRVAEAVADRAPVDWVQESQVNRELEEELRGLEFVEKIGRAHRALEEAAQLEISGGGSESAETLAKPAVTEAFPSAQWGHLRVRQRIGGGNYGDVYSAYDPALQRAVALKLLRPRDEPFEGRGERFLEEARRLARVRHTNVLVVHGAEEHGGRVGLWTDLVEGRTLERLLLEQGPLSAGEATTIGIDLCRALAAVHGAGLVHGDVKTSNVMRERGGRIVLMDFSSVRERNPLDAEIAPPGGTPLYLAPEVFQGAQPTRKTDIYALGVLLYRLVSGRYPVEAERLDDLTGKHARGSSVPLRDVCPDLPPAFVHTVERALEQDPIHRYASVGEMERDLVASLGLTHKPQAEKEDVPIWRRSWFQGLVGTAFVMGLYAVLNQVLLPNEFHVQASLFRSSRGTEERLLEGATVSPGDDLFLEIEGSERMYVYVLNEDERGNAFVLFPLPDVVPQNPLASDASYRLPGRLDGVDSYWEVSTSGGTETLLVVASWQRLVDVERFIQTLDLAGQSGPIVSQPNAPQPRRGIGGLSGPNGKLERSVLSVIHDELGARNRKDGLWVWQFQLKNRGE